MSSGKKVWLTVVGLVCLLLVQFGSANGAELRYIRIGEHKNYTRIVFEFRGAAVHNEPVVRGKGKFSVVFGNTTTDLPNQIKSETSKRVDAIAFAQQNSSLAANISLSFPYFEIKSFTLSKPDRVVLDVKKLKKPPQSVVFEEQLEKEKPPLIKTAPVTKPRVDPKTILKAEATTPSIQKGSSNAPKTPNKPKASAPKEEISATARQSETSPKVAKETQTAFREPPRTQTAEKIVTDSKTRTGSLATNSDLLIGGRLQTYLLMVLLGISVIIVGLLVVVVFRKKRVVEKTVSPFTMPVDKADSIAAIDAKLRKKLSRI